MYNTRRGTEPMRGRGTGHMGRWGAERGSMMGRGTGQMVCWGAEHGSMMGRGTGQMVCWGAEHRSMMGRGTGQMVCWGAEHGSMMGRGTGQMGCWGAEYGSMMGRGTGQMGCWGAEYGSTSHLAQNEWRMPLRPLWRVGLGTWGDPRLMVTSRPSSSSSSWYAHHMGSSPSEQDGLYIRRLQEDNAQRRSQFERDMQVQFQREMERQVQEHTQQRKLEANAREQAREREWQQREFDVLLSDTPIGIRGFTRMEEVIVSAPVQECLMMEVDKVEGDAKLTELKKPNRQKKCRSKNKLLAKGEDTENPNTSVGAMASADQEIIMQSPAAETASHDILSLAATVDKQMTVLRPAPVQECLVMETDKHEFAAKLTKSQKRKWKRYHKKKANKDLEFADKHEFAAKLTKSQKRKWKRYHEKKANKDLESLGKREGTDNPRSLGAIASIDLRMMVLSPTATVDENSSIPSTNATDQIASGDTLSTKVHEAVSGETGSGKTVSDSTTSKKRKRNQRAKKKVAGDVLSAKVDEIVSGETVPDKAVTDCTTQKKENRNKKKKKVAGDVLSAKVNEVSGETVPSKKTTNNTTSKKKKRNKKKRKLKAVAGDIFSTCENIQSKVNAIDGSSATEVTEAISGEMVSSKTALPDVKMVSKEEEHTEAANGKTGSSATTNLKVNGAVNSVLTIGEILAPQNLKADNGYAREDDIAGAKGKECGWIYE